MSDEPRAAQVVSIDLPLHARHASTVRMVAGSIAADAGFDVDAIDDVRLGVNEAVSVLTDVDHDGTARMSIRFEFAPGVMHMRARRHGVATPLLTTDIDPLAAKVLGTVVDSYEIDGDEFVVTKTAG